MFYFFHKEENLTSIAFEETLHAYFLNWLWKAVI